MARYTAAHSRQTRQNIVNAANRRFKRDGIDGTGISALLGDAGLTNGAFYKHFDAKDDLVATVIAEDLDARADWLAAQPRGRSTVEEFIRDYLTAYHRDHRDESCISAALVADIARRDLASRRAYTQGFRGFVRLLAGHLRPDHGAAADDVALELLALLYGTLQLARAVADPAFSDRILDRGLAAALARLDMTKSRT